MTPGMVYEEPGPVQLAIGKMIGHRWKVIDKLGEGGCGSVYLVEDQRSRARAAMKAESNYVAGGSVLKLEAQVLRRLAGRRYVAKLLAAGKKERYCYMVMTLFGPSLSRIFKVCNKEFTISTQVRLGMQILYGLKQLHEVGFVHRDLKMANLAVGSSGREARVLHLLDFGLAREFVAKDENGRLMMRRPRESTLFRGTIKYCSANSHRRCEQGRPDDLWSMVYVLAEMREALPWDRIRDKHEVGRMKRQVADADLFTRSPRQLVEICAHLRELNYFTRPDYRRVFAIFEDIMDEFKVSFADPFDWETDSKKGILERKAPILRRKRDWIKSVTEDISVTKTSADTIVKPVKLASSEDLGEHAPPFSADEFERNDIGF